MTTIVGRLDLHEYEAEHGWPDAPSLEDERVLSDDEVARLLLDGSEPERLETARAAAMAIEAFDDRDSLTEIRGIIIGLAWVAQFWMVVAAILILT